MIGILTLIVIQFAIQLRILWYIYEISWVK